MGSVWAARVRGGGAPSCGCPGSWVAVKAIPLELGPEGAHDAGGLHDGLRECLSTFRGLSQVHVVRYESYWLEELDALPEEVRDLCNRRLGRRATAVAAAAAAAAAAGAVLPATRATGSGAPAAAACTQLPAPLPATPTALSVAESVATLCASLRFQCGLGGAGASAATDLRGRWPLSPSEYCATPTSNSCGFIWEHASPPVPSEDPSPRGGAAAGPGEASSPSTPVARMRGPGRGEEAPVAQPGTKSYAVLLIEMELMGPSPDAPPDSEERPVRETLRVWLQREDRTLTDAADVFGSLMLSVRHIHRKRIVHADLKPDNLFCAGQSSRVAAVRIGDFGLAGENQQGRYLPGQAGGNRILGGTPGYVAPEVLRAGRERDLEVCPSDKVDIFACAVILLELLLTPFRTQMERVEVLERFRNEKAPFNVPEFIVMRLPKTRALLQEMSEHDPAERLSAEEVCKRFEKEVRKELCRSSVQACCGSSVLPCSVPRRAGKLSAACAGLEHDKERSQEPKLPRPRRKGRKAGRRGG